MIKRQEKKLSNREIHIVLPENTAQRLDAYLLKNFGVRRGMAMIIRKAIIEYLDRVEEKQ